MKTSGLVLWGSLATLGLTLAADGCGGRAELYAPAGDGGTGSSSGVTGSSSGVSGSSSGITGSSSGVDGGGSGSSSGVSGSSSGVSGSSSGISGSSSGISGSSSGVSGSSSGGGPNGSIFIEQCDTALCQSQQFSVYAQFFTSPQGNMGCTVTTAGSCVYYSNCTGGPTQNGVSAGTLTVAGPWLMPPVTITPMSGTNAYQYSASTTGFSSGQTLAVSATGGVVPAFGPVSVVVPDLTSIYQPPIDTDGGTTTIPTNGALVVAWTGGQAGATMIFQAGGNGSADYMDCTWNGSDGKGVVPAAMLKPFSGQQGYLLYGQYNVTSFSAGPFAVTLNALPYTGGLVQFQ
ncbi:MAG TPA: hypothetical protein VF765_10395 [Polyangiaceae bacterium]